MLSLVRLVLLLALLPAAVLPVRAAEIAPGVAIRARDYPVPLNEVPFFGFRAKTDEQRAADARFIATFEKPGGQTRREGAEAIVDTALDLIAGKDLLTAARRLNQAWLLAPDLSAVAHLFAFVVQHRFGDNEYAIELLQAATRLREPLPTLSADLGSLLLLANRPAQAIPPLRAAIAADAGNALPRMNLAKALFATGDREGACRAAAEVRGENLAEVAKDLAALKTKARCG